MLSYCFMDEVWEKRGVHVKIFPSAWLGLAGQVK